MVQVPQLFYWIRHYPMISPYCGLGSSTIYVHDEVSAETNAPHLQDEGEIQWKKFILKLHKQTHMYPIWQNHTVIIPYQCSGSSSPHEGVHSKGDTADSIAEGD